MTHEANLNLEYCVGKVLKIAARQPLKYYAADGPPPKTVAEFFAGIGLMRMDLEKAGWKTIFANDIDPL